MKIGVVGTGMIAKLVVPHLGEWGADVAAVCGTPQTLNEAEELAGQYGAQVFTDYTEMLACSVVDTAYVAVPNHLHFTFTKQALEAGKHAIVEKPFTSNVEEAEQLVRLASERGRYVFEAISTLYLPNFAKIRELLPLIGEVKIVSANYSQYSSRYDAFRSGDVLPAFDPAKSGGALMDLGLYNLHYILGLFGAPKDACYVANVERGIDTSGVVTLGYDGFKAVSVAAKDCAAPASYVIQGTAGYIRQEVPANRCGAVTLHLNDGTEKIFDDSPELQWESEFRAFANMLDNGDDKACKKALEHSLAVSRVMTGARRAAGVVFAADEPYLGE